ncbi:MULTISPECIES: helix-turn-helix domain-containing protein [Flavobacterium]|uniref:helix-turn-helix domain-containing protein n=1 Tax=Flavobacterium TaxID=237 RepID=UPI002113C2D3|nr:MULTISPECIES: helix-turn-helix domain-containing protein [Flavobacterium]UUF15200.1 helix-turn-helix domain-containing protein [Flavobacterium panici]
MKNQELSFETLPSAVGLILKEMEEIKKILINDSSTNDPEIKRLSTNEAIKFIREQGFPISKSKLYKLTSEGKIPHEKFGMRVLFKKDNLVSWFANEIKSSMKLDSEYAMIIANSARKKSNN